MSTTPDIHEPTESEIQHTAYLLWLESGREPGRDLDNWLAARELLRHRHAPGKTPRAQVKASFPPAIPAKETARKN